MAGPTGTTTAPAGKVLPPELQRAVARVTELGSLPEVTMRIVEVVENPRATARQVHEVVRADPALAAKILKIVNSSFYGLPSQIASLERAIVMLGLSALKNLALATSLLRLMKTDDLGSGFKARDLWLHCVAVGVAARQIAATGHAAPPDEAFVGGLMHDLGLIVCQQLFPKKLGEIIERCRREPQNFCACEETVIGADHQVLGAALAARWKFPPGLRNAIGYHHDPASLQTDHQPLAAVIYLADTLACNAEFGFWLTGRQNTPAEWMLTLVNLPAPEFDTIRTELPARLCEAEQILGQA